MLNTISLRQKIIIGVSLLLIAIISVVYVSVRSVVDDSIFSQDARTLHDYANIVINSLDNETLRNAIENNEQQGLNEVYGVVIFDINNNILMKNKRVRSNLISIPIKDEVVRREISGDNKVLIVYDKSFLHHGSTKIIRVAKSVSWQEGLVQGINKTVNIITFIAVIIAILGMTYITGKAIEPIHKVVDAANSFGSGDYSARVDDIKSMDEVGELAVKFNAMADNIERAFEREKQFTSDVSHELRTPLAVILTNAEYAEQANDIEVYRKTNKEIMKKSVQLQQLITQLLGLAREVEQTTMLETMPIDISSMLLNITDEYFERAEEKNLTFDTEVEKALIVNADLMLMTRLIVNLLDNAVKYNNDGGSVNIKAFKKGSNAYIQVADTGIGIAESDLPHIFKRLYRVDKARSDGSSGLGLSFVEMIARLHNGRISVESVQGKGSTFTVELPIK